MYSMASVLCSFEGACGLGLVSTEVAMMYLFLKNKLKNIMNNVTQTAITIGTNIYKNQ